MRRRYDGRSNNSRPQGFMRDESSEEGRRRRTRAEDSESQGFGVAETEERGRGRAAANFDPSQLGLARNVGAEEGSGAGNEQAAAQDQRNHARSGNTTSAAYHRRRCPREQQGPGAPAAAIMRGQGQEAHVPGRQGASPEGLPGTENVAVSKDARRHAGQARRPPPLTSAWRRDFGRLVLAGCPAKACCGVRARLAVCAPTRSRCDARRLPGRTASRWLSNRAACWKLTHSGPRPARVAVCPALLWGGERASMHVRGGRLWIAMGSCNALPSHRSVTFSRGRCSEDRSDDGRWFVARR